MEASAEAPAIYLEPIKHSFSHYRLTIRPILLKIIRASEGVAEVNSSQWIDPQTPGNIGLPVPVTQVLKTLALLQ